MGAAFILLAFRDRRLPANSPGGNTSPQCSICNNQQFFAGRTHLADRRSRGYAQSIVQIGDLTVNVDAKTVHIKQVRVNLTGKEYQILELLSLRRGTTITKEMFLSQLYGGMDEPKIKIIDVFMCKIRRKLATASNGKDHIETVWGRGYLLREPDEVSAKMSHEPQAGPACAVRRGKP
jgi:DNA-binding winged helix-turn-helix (wHTH) protein